MKQHLKRLLLLALLAALLLTPAEAVGLGHVNTAAGLRLRSEPSTSGSVLAVVPNGAEVVALKLSNGWYTVRYQNQVGYMDASYLEVAQSGSFATPLIGSISGQAVNLRSEPNTTSDVVTTLAAGTQVTVTGIQSSWYVVSFGSVAGYIHPSYVELLDVSPVGQVVTVAPATGAGPDTVDPAGETVEPAAPAEPAEPSPEPTAEPEPEDTTRYAVVNGSVVNVRAEATTSSDVLTKLNRGTRVVLLESVGGWYRIQYGDLTGYMSAEYLLETGAGASGTSSLRQEIVDYASQYLGIMYRYGGKSPSTGFDCSGFVYYVFGHFGYTLNPGASNQMRTTHAITRSELLPGDLVFFNNGTASLASHVGIYIGDGNFIHSTSPGHPVAINALTDSYYSRYYVGAGRVIFD